MSATLILSKRSSWMPSSGVFESILQKVINVLQVSNSAFAEYFEQSQVPGYFADITEVPKPDFQDFCEAVIQVNSHNIAKLTSEDVTDDTRHIDTVYPQPLVQLKALISLDDRAGPVFTSGTQLSVLRMTNELEWLAPLWVSDLVVEWLAVSSQLIPNHLSLARSLALQSSSENKLLNISELKINQYCAMAEAIEFMKQYFEHPDGGRVAYSYRFNPQLADRIPILFEMFKSQKMYSNCAKL